MELQCASSVMVIEIDHGLMLAWIVYYSCTIAIPCCNICLVLQNGNTSS